MKCLNCGLINPETAERCDCGYNFASRTVLASYFPNPDTWPYRNQLLAFIYTVIIFVTIGPPIGLIGGIYAPAVLGEGVSSLSVKDFVLLLYPAYVFGFIPALGTGIVYVILRQILLKRITQAFLWRAILSGAIGAAVTGVCYQASGLSPDMMFMTGLPAGIVCGILAPISDRLIKHKRVR